MRVTGIEIDVKANLIETMGEPYAFVGGVVDLRPERSGYFKLSDDYRITVHLADVTDDNCMNVTRTYSLDSPGVRGTFVLTYEVWRGQEGGIPALVANARMYEDHEAAPAGFTDALVAWIRKQGLTDDGDAAWSD